MTAIFEFPLPSETLEPGELERITGATQRAGQIAWLDINSWLFHKNKAGEPIVGRMYARLRMAGINPVALTTSGGWVPDFSNLDK